jgi:hypothetical protein
VPAVQPTATTTTAASALPRTPSFEKFILTPPGASAKDSIDPKSSCTAIPAARNAAATAVDTSSSSVGRMRGAAWKSSTRVPNALKIDATWAPVAPAPMTSIVGGADVRPHASLCVAVSSNPGTARRRLTPPVQTMIFSARKRNPLWVSTVYASAKRAMPACSWTATPAASTWRRNTAWARASSTTSRTRASSRG